MLRYYLMKSKVALLICIIMFGLNSCHKNETDEFQSSAIITGPDYRACACCGGWFIDIDTVTYLFDTLPENSGINLEKETFPLPVKLDWQFSDRPACPANRILILRIKKE